MIHSSATNTARMCMWLETNETKCYCNREALRFLADRIRAIASSPINEYHEVHLALAMHDAEVFIVDRRKCVSADPGDEISADATPIPFEVTFMCVEEADLEKMKRDRS